MLAYALKKKNVRPYNEQRFGALLSTFILLFCFCVDLARIIFYEVQKQLFFRRLHFELSKFDPILCDSTLLFMAETNIL